MTTSLTLTSTSSSQPSAVVTTATAPRTLPVVQVSPTVPSGQVVVASGHVKLNSTVSRGQTSATTGFSTTATGPSMAPMSGLASRTIPRWSSVTPSAAPASMAGLMGSQALNIKASVGPP